MSFTTFLLRLVGRSPEQIQEQERFEQNLKALDESTKELDKVLEDIRAVDRSYQEKKEAAVSAILSSSPPPRFVPSEEEDVRIRYASDPDL